MSASPFIRKSLVLLLALGLFPSLSFGAEREPWSKEIVNLFATLPVQDGGRIKPLDTYAQFTMLQLNGKRSFTTEDGERLKPVPWLLDALFYPEIASTYQHFIVDNYDVISAMGVEIHDKRRSRYSYDELKPGVDTLMSLAREYNEIDAKKRDLVQQGVLDQQCISLYPIDSLYGFCRGAVHGKGRHGAGPGLPGRRGPAHERDPRAGHEGLGFPAGQPG